MKCPHCLTSFHKHLYNVDIGDAKGFRWSVIWQPCPECGEAIIILKKYNANKHVWTERTVNPKNVSRTPISKDVPIKFADDYKEACLVLADSPKASAALSRRCLQHILREKAGVKKSNLNNEIDEVLALKQLPSHLADDIDAIRQVGNFAAHPIKSKNTGEIVDVESGEAEWLLNVIEGLFDFYFVQPAKQKKKREKLNKKLEDAGKPPLKTNS